MPEPGRVYWSAAAKRFYQEGRVGAVSAKEAASFLHYNEPSARFTDQRGQFVPSNSVLPPSTSTRFLTRHDAAGRAFLSTEISYETIRDDLAKTLLKARQVQNNQQVIVWDVLTDGRGNTYTVETSTVLGGKVTYESLIETANKRDRGTLFGKAGIKSGAWQDRFLLSRVIRLMTVTSTKVA